MPVRYGHDAPGDLAHRDIKKLGKVSAGGRHRKQARARHRQPQEQETGAAVTRCGTVPATTTAGMRIQGSDEKRNFFRVLDPRQRPQASTKLSSNDSSLQRDLLPLNTIRSGTRRHEVQTYPAVPDADQ